MLLKQSFIKNKHISELKQLKQSLRKIIPR